MAALHDALHDALQSLGPIPWDQVPQSQDALREYILDIADKAKLIVNSIPESTPSNEPSESPLSSSPSSPLSRIKNSPARVGETDTDIQSLQQQWGKAIKMNSAKDNPFRIPVYKLSGNDGKGAWFSRRSVHEGLPFSTWKDKISTEMQTTLKANEECMKKGQIPDKAVRGIGAEKEVESIEVMDAGGKTLIGTIKVYHVSCRFPRPTTSRDFVVLGINWEHDLGGVEVEGQRGRCYMMVSKPCLHPDVPATESYIRGEYESVEIVREIPVKKSSKEGSSSPSGSKSESSTEGKKSDGDKKNKKQSKKEKAAQEKLDKEKSEGHQERQSEDGEESNPVEWIMVTRSDPGGTIPRWMVEKGTPKSICTDTVKFLTWACRDTQSVDESENEEEPGVQPGEEKVPQDVHEDSDSDSSEYDSAYEEVEHHGLIASFAYLLNAGLERYAPQSVLNYMPQHSRESSQNIHTDGHVDDEKGTGDARSKIEHGETGSVISPSKASIASTNSELATPSLENGHNVPPAEVIQMQKKGKMTSHEKNLAKLAQRKREVETKLESVRAEIQALNLNQSQPDISDPKKAKGELNKDNNSNSDIPNSSTSSLPQATEGRARADTTSSSKSNSRNKRTSANPETAQMHKAASGMFSNESKLLKELGKIEKEQLKIAAKVESQVRKDAKREEKTQSRSKVDEMRKEIDDLKKEVDRLRAERKQWLDLVGTLEAENSRLLGKAGGDGK